MRNLGRPMAWLAATLLAGTACSAPDPAPHPQPPRIDAPLDVARYQNAPCDILPDDLGERFGLNQHKTYRDWAAIPQGGRQPACELFRGTQPPSITIRLYPEIRPVPTWTKRVKDVKPDTVRGYPAGIYPLATTGGPEAPSICTTFVDLAPNQGLAAVYNAGAGANPCPVARQAAAAVVGKLSR